MSASVVMVDCLASSIVFLKAQEGSLHPRLQTVPDHLWVRLQIYPKHNPEDLQFHRLL